MDTLVPDMSCLAVDTAIFCYRDSPGPIVSRIQTNCDNKIYLSKYPKNVFDAMGVSDVVELYYKDPAGQWQIKKFMKAYTKFVTDPPIALATPLAVEV